MRTKTGNIVFKKKGVWLSKSSNILMKKRRRLGEGHIFVWWIIREEEGEVRRVRWEKTSIPDCKN